MTQPVFPPRVLVLLAGVSLAAGAIIPWLTMPEGPPEPPPTAPSTVDQGGPWAAASTVTDPPAPAITGAVTASGAVAIGDGVVLRARACLEKRGIVVYDEPVSDPAALRELAGTLARDYAAVFIHVGHRDGIVDGQIADIMDAIGPERRIVWATLQLPEPSWGQFTFEDRTNASIRSVVPSMPDARVFDWNALTVRHPDWLLDGLRPSPSGCEEYAQRVARLTDAPLKT